MEATLKNAINTLRVVAQTYVTDELGHLQPQITADWLVVEFLAAAGQIETHDVKDPRSNTTSRQHTIKSGDPNEAGPIDRNPNATAAMAQGQEDGLAALRARQVLGQLARFGGAAGTSEMTDLLEQLAELGLDIHERRSSIFAERRIRVIRAALSDVVRP